MGSLKSGTSYGLSSVDTSYMISYGARYTKAVRSSYTMITAQSVWNESWTIMFQATPISIERIDKINAMTTLYIMVTCVLLPTVYSHTEILT
jgi:hypothetical protein